MKKRMNMGGMANGRGTGLPPGLANMKSLPKGLAKMDSLPKGLKRPDAQTMKKGGMVMRGAGCATKGKKISSKMG